MKLTVFNGSGRGAKSNTTLLMTHFMRGFESIPGNQAHMLYLNPKMDSQPVDAFLASDVVMLAFPLYVDAMPGMVKHFIESLRPYCGREGNPILGYVVHSGFPEALHGRYVERYLEKLTRRLGCKYAGCIVRGGTEGIQIMPEKMMHSLYLIMEELGQSLGQKGVMDAQLLLKAAGRERYPSGSGFFIKLLGMLGLINSYWDGSLKKNNVFKQRYAHPYAKDRAD
jgi:multimeric flavodoxin WrbA